MEATFHIKSQPHIPSKQNEPYLSIGKSSPIQAYHTTPSITLALNL
jgi:hypothetical protein